MEIHTALKLESDFSLGYVGVERTPCAIPEFRDTTGSRSGQIPHSREILPMASAKPIGCIAREDNSTWRSHGWDRSSTTITVIS